MSRFYKTIILTEVLSDGEFVWEDLKEVHNAIRDGDCSGTVNQVSSHEITTEELIKSCRRHDTDPEFFLGEGYFDEIKVQAGVLVDLALELHNVSVEDSATLIRTVASSVGDKLKKLAATAEYAV